DARPRPLARGRGRDRLRARGGADRCESETEVSDIGRAELSEVRAEGAELGVSGGRVDGIRTLAGTVTRCRRVVAGIPGQEGAHERGSDDIAGDRAEQRAREHRPETGAAGGDARRAARERPFERAGPTQFGAGRGAGERRGLAREGALTRGRAARELFVDERALAIGEPSEGFGVHLLDGLRRGGAKKVAVTIESLLVGAPDRLRRRSGRLRARRSSAEQSIQESHGASVAHGTEPVWGAAGMRLVAA